MVQIRLFSGESSFDLEKKVNEFMKGKNILSVSYSTNTCGYSIHHFCCVTYQGW